MKFWDSSAIVPLLVREAASGSVKTLALQRAAALFVAEARPSTLEFVSLDGRLLAAARREGIATTRPSS